MDWKIDAGKIRGCAGNSLDRETNGKTSGFVCESAWKHRPEEEIESVMDPMGSRCVNTTRSAGKDRMPASL